ncbi:MAG TPA: DEAD/DEAH box helicase [Zoogloea sp.]|uniref:DEAD/DEAH box helicase n=1 Tax=Zoogloea sp. TaxID=49181 RepID=UPI002B942F68|nr:DEAD/DEAH box helicase [Zoogloea sp.]HMY49019.1 DEAD/DEAH box helicase [Rhodocyclaceae bacterium]HMZ75215.1 DEAD/DEAH box helicase [Rhodocyclaceae bacterium]HNA68701.1 DEAD/DEAH box helicase [Rhodocyclaceae bacterium]HNB65302.1 DEAD/DEAH box helicase [Rhodocyclaceae bacterium]HND24997.1 DEAD/DEAH box helicase [Rhodocyclaceae bacterium]
MDLQRLVAQIDDALLAELFSANALAKARAYVGRVQHIEAAGHQIQALVQGSDAAPYHVTVRIERREFFGKSSIELATRCTCPVGNRCKHAAALVLAARRAGALVDKPRAEILNWARSLGERLAKADKNRRKAAASEAIFYLCSAAQYGDDVEFGLLKGRVGADGHPSGRASAWYNYDQALLKPPSFVRDEDLQVFRLLREVVRHGAGYGRPRLRGTEGLALFEAALATGRAYLELDDNGRIQPLQAAAPRPGALIWAPDEAGLRPRVAVTPAAPLVIRTEPLAWIDSATGEAGRVNIDGGGALLEVLALPPLSTTEIPVVAAALAQVAPALPRPGAADATELPVLDVPCQPVMQLESLRCWSWRKHRSYPADFLGQDYDVAIPAFHYGDVRFEPGSTHEIAALPDGRTVRIARDKTAEAAAWRAFQNAGFQPVKPGWLMIAGSTPAGLHGLESEAHWTHFFSLLAPALRDAGWRIDCPADFRHRVLTPGEWFADISETDDGGFAVALGVEVDGHRRDLAPMLHAVFRQDRRWLDRAQVDAIPDDAPVTILTEDGDRIVLPAGRLKPIARTLVDLFDSPAGALKVSRLDAPRLAEAFADGWRAEGLASVDAWIERLRGAGGIAPVPPPAGFAHDLRPYQREGLAWLQHLRQHRLGGILADDMGLGKTAQTLAHLLTEKHAGRLDKPALVVLPTSLVFNWQQEAARFAPALRVLGLRGSSRADAFARIPEHDICLTTYPLLWRDRDALSAHAYHSLILDEAQTVKNAASQAAQVVRGLRADHRLCLTGTPLENHLGELWSQFDFLLPGFLGDAKDFTTRWRTPIEKHGDLIRRDILARRIAPFILRRRKEDVAKELPPKTIVVRSVELDGRQRDLYETVRASMDQRVRDEIAARGFARSQIVILDALLKLRQVCCDPRLLKTDAAAKVKERAKLDLLMDMLPELVEEGRRILLFSQFTAMLQLIAAELTARKIPFVTLTGDTDDRAAPVRAFQEGSVPLFLISLKAGGVGLNLTAADTVIHYDPWWNPAVENQATDRAHRLGQTKAVFVYKLVVAGSIEEKILALQEKKAELAAGILAEDHEGSVKFGEDDLRALLAPLPETPREEADAAPKKRGRPKKTPG